MLDGTQREALKTFFQSLEDRPLEPNELLYEPKLHSQGSFSDPVEDLVQLIDWAEKPTVNLVSGQRGAGKSTEMRRLRHTLRQRDCVVILIDIAEYINPALPLDITDFLLVLMGALSDETQRLYPSFKTESTYWERLSKFLKTDLKLEFGIKAGLDIKMGLKDDPTFKKHLQARLAEKLGRLVRQVRDYTQLVAKFIRAQEGSKKVVLLVDSLEKLRGVGEDAKKVHDSVENLFNVHSHHLNLDPLHVVYTIPPYLTTLAPGLSKHLGGGNIINLANAHVFDRERNPDEQGLATMRSLVGRRYKEWEKILSTEQLNNIILSTGGDIRDCLRMLQAILISAPRAEAQFPISDNSIQAAQDKMRRDMLPITEEDRIWLLSIHQTHNPGLAKIEELRRLAHFFDSNLVQCYRNGEDWYDVHPLMWPVINPRTSPL